MDVTAEHPPESPAPPRRVQPRRRYLLAGGICAAGVVYLVAGGLSNNIVYFRTVSEAVAERSDEGVGRLRMAGAVVSGSLERRSDGVVFRVTDGKATASVIHRGDPPELFKEGAPVVCEGRWRGTTFSSDRIMIKHGSEYRPPEVQPGKGAPPPS